MPGTAGSLEIEEYLNKVMSNPPQRKMPTTCMTAVADDMLLEVAKLKEGADAMNSQAYDSPSLLRSASQVSRGEEMIKLYVGGEVMATNRTTLTQVEGSLLANMFSTEDPEGLFKDRKGRVFLDYDPTHFKAILSFLRLRLIDEAKAKRMWGDQLRQDPQLALLWSHLGNGKEMAGCEPFRFDSSYPEGEAVISKAGRRVTFQNGTLWTRVSASPGMQAGHVYFWKLVVEQTNEYQTLTFGVSGGQWSARDKDPRYLDSFLGPSSYCWLAGPVKNTPYMFVDGWRRGHSRVWAPLAATDCAVFKLDLSGREGVLSMWSSTTKEVYTMEELDLKEQWYFTVFASGSHVLTLMDPIEEEKQLVD